MLCSWLVAVHAKSSWSLIFLFLPDPVQFLFNQIPTPNPLSSQKFLSVHLALFPTCLFTCCSCTLGQGRVCEGAGSAKFQGGTGLVFWIATIHSFAYLEILLGPWLEFILKGEKFQGI